jgi:hypothetical protein
MVTILRRDLSYERFELLFEPCVAVSEQFEDKRRLSDIAINLGHTPFETTVQWPRDHLVFHNGVVMTEDYMRGFGEGGMTSYNENNFFISYVVLHIGYNRHKVRMIERALGTPVHLVPSPERNNHIDLVMLALNDTILVDKEYHEKHAHYFTDIENVFPVHFPQEEKNYFPLNCLVLDNVVIANKNTPTLHGVLKDLRVDYETVDAHYSYNLGGSIRCRTNQADHPAILRRAGIHITPIKKEDSGSPDISLCRPDRNSSA